MWYVEEFTNGIWWVIAEFDDLTEAQEYSRKIPKTRVRAGM